MYPAAIVRSLCSFATGESSLQAQDQGVVPHQQLHTQHQCQALQLRRGESQEKHCHSQETHPRSESLSVIESSYYYLPESC